jgi:ParB-like chromosome segregation protein Spo0J
MKKRKTAPRRRLVALVRSGRPTMKIADIKVGERHRKEMGDIAALAASIGETGLLHPVVVSRDGKLIAGERRLLAAQQLGWTEVPVTVVDLDNIVHGEFAENTERKDFTYTEAVAIKRAIEPVEKAAAKERQRTGARQGRKALGKLPTASKGRAADKAAKATGRKRRSLEKAEAVMKAAEAEPERFGDLAKRLDEEGARVDAIHQEMRRRQERTSGDASTADTSRSADSAPTVTNPPSSPAPAPQSIDPYSASEHDRLRAHIDELNIEKRQLEIKIAGLESEVWGLKTANRELKTRIAELVEKSSIRETALVPAASPPESAPDDAADLDVRTFAGGSLRR